MRAELGAVRDLIEAGLSEPADALATYGISAATLVPGDRAWVMQCPMSVMNAAKPLALVEAIDASIGILGGLRDGASVRRAGRQDGGHRGLLRPSTLMPRRCHDRCWGDTLWS